MFIDTFMFVRYKTFFGNLSCKRTIQYGTLFFDSKDLKKKTQAKKKMFELHMGFTNMISLDFIQNIYYIWL